MLMITHQPESHAENEMFVSGIALLGIQEVRNSTIIPNLRSLHVRKVVLFWRVTSSNANAELQASLPAVVSLCGAFKCSFLDCDRVFSRPG